MDNNKMKYKLIWGFCVNSRYEKANKAQDDMNKQKVTIWHLGKNDFESMPSFVKCKYCQTRACVNIKLQILKSIYR